ncbi:hypothetical protein [Streptomyces sp. UNOB3_S3]|uniref:hypothetical protein n=1 Tax=Streptomyces sp. UNOB3_S3 TaxID=2871682 RepID=UPI001E4373C0|nr:hypothetical protein [Streptomyces sp. UNOB3_S3]MCC3774435.1 hypothetical protein [Streptomyces sp. UNOB3_S3]
MVTRRNALTRALLALLAGTVLVLGGTAPAHATQRDSAPAATPGGIDETIVFGRKTVVPRPYTPDPTTGIGPNACLLKYHEYDPTPGCGGFTLDVTLHNVRSQPGYLAGKWGNGNWFKATADTARTFGCRTADGTFDWSTAFVVRTERTPLQSWYYYADPGWITHMFRGNPGQDFGPQFAMNFPAVKVDCAPGTTPVQYGLKVTNLDIAIEGSDVYGTTTWHHDGPFYG